jgi:photosystem II stability/assembly factor-like uncharacterized protein
MKNNIMKIKKNKRNITTIPFTCIFLLLSITMLITASFTNATFTIKEETLEIPRLEGGWDAQQSGTTKNLWGLSFTDANTGTAVGDTATILRTTDGGDNWLAQTCGLSIHLYDVSFSDTNTGVAGGTSGTIIYTTDAGDTWITHQTGWLMQYYSALMETSTIGILVGETSLFTPMVTWTTNGWQTHTTNSFYLNNNEGELWDFHYGSSTIWYAAAKVWNNEGAIARTTDGGANWETICWTDRAFFGMDFPSTNIGYAVGLAGIMVKTTDGGNTWNPLSSGVSSTLLDVSFTTNTCGTVVGEAGLILRTEDGGSTWAVQESGTTSDLRGVQFIDSNIGFAVGENGVILHTTTGGYAEDQNPPVTTCSLNGTMNGSVYTSDVTVTLTATDDNSGVNFTMYQVDSGSWTTYTTPLVIIADGDHIVYFYSIDNAGNIEPMKNTTFTIQHPAPPITITIKGGFGVSVTITNTGPADLTDVSWSIALDGKLIFFGKSKTGSIDLLTAGDSETVKDFIFGIGKTDITVDTGYVSETMKGSVLLFFVKVT